jgi:hypothetical protein
LFFFYPRFYRAKKFNTAAKWTGVIGGTIGLIISAFMLLKKSSKKGTISSAGAEVNDEKSNVEKSLDGIRYLDDKSTEAAEASEQY